MPLLRNLPARPRLAGVVAATAATVLGIAIMAAAGAPPAFAIINMAALVIGAALLALMLRARLGSIPPDGAIILAAAAGLLATAAGGVAIDGAARWVRVGMVSLQPGLVLLPVMIIAYARQPGRVATLGMVIAALALQPDRALAGTLLAGLLVAAIRQRGVGVVTALAAAMIGFVVTLLRPDDLPATAFVERVVTDAFARSAIAGGTMVAGVALLLLPACNRAEPARVFAAVWLAIFLTAMVGNYPTPLLGYGGSGIIGYLIRLASLPARTRPAPVDRGGADLYTPGTRPIAGNGRTETMTLYRGQRIPNVAGSFSCARTARSSAPRR
jgi:hypothetical protein